NATDAILLRNATGRIAFASPACLKLIGYSVEEMRALSPEDLIHSDDLDRVMTLTRAIGPANPSASSIHRLRH
ncbi:PAS domain-containing protein, partial [Enterobacter hormaechei]|uniref:PAS domain-containing protein n=1 Tax=Enterobacter hormaechei TaxID=158836 RepID=UPI0013D62ACB